MFKIVMLTAVVFWLGLLAGLGMKEMYDKWTGNACILRVRDVAR